MLHIILLNSTFAHAFLFFGLLQILSSFLSVIFVYLVTGFVSDYSFKSLIIYKYRNYTDHDYSPE